MVNTVFSVFLIEAASIVETKHVHLAVGTFVTAIELYAVVHIVGDIDLVGVTHFGC